MFYSPIFKTNILLVQMFGLTLQCQPITISANIIKTINKRYDYERIYILDRKRQIQ